MRPYRYVGPAELRELATAAAAGQVIRDAVDLAAWLASRPEAELAEPFTFVIDFDGNLRLAPRRSEHVACAGDGPVLSAGEIGFNDRPDWTVGEITNQSTGYCPDPSSWPAVAAALDRIGLTHPGHFTTEIVFRRCPECRELNIVKEADYTCVFCAADLPPAWNIDECRTAPT